MSADTFYTDEMLDETFRMIRDGFDWTAKGFGAIDKHFAHLEGHIGELSKAQAKLIAKTPKTRKLLPFVVGVAVGVYLVKRGKNIAKKVDIVFDNANEDAKQRFTAHDVGDANVVIEADEA